jgi:hypothetical protein
LRAFVAGPHPSLASPEQLAVFTFTVVDTSCSDIRTNDTMAEPPCIPRVPVLRPNKFFTKPCGCPSALIRLLAKQMFTTFRTTPITVPMLAALCSFLG